MTRFQVFASVMHFAEIETRFYDFVTSLSLRNDIVANLMKRRFNDNVELYYYILFNYIEK
jgi:hypothetical protein